MRLTKEEIRLLLKALAEKYGPGYSDDKEVSPQAKLSVMLEAKGYTIL